MLEAICLIGLQCSGKSTLCKEYKDLGYAICSSDEIRLEHPTFDNQQVFEMLYDMMASYLEDGISVVIDATNMTKKSRKSFFTTCSYIEDFMHSHTDDKEYKIFKRAIILNTPYHECLKRLTIRNNSDYPIKIPEDALCKYYNSYQFPLYNEGFDKIQFAFNRRIDIDIIKKSLDFKHNDKYHGTESVYEHISNIMNLYVKDCVNNPDNQPIDYYTMNLLTLSHDLGKFICAKQSPKDPDSLCYYGHPSVGAWELGAMFQGEILESDIRYLILANTCYHMDVQNMKQSTLEKYFNEELRNILLYFSKLDLASTQLDDATF